MAGAVSAVTALPLRGQGGPRSAGTGCHCPPSQRPARSWEAGPSKRLSGDSCDEHSADQKTLGSYWPAFRVAKGRTKVFTKSLGALLIPTAHGEAVISMPGLGRWDLHRGAPVLKAENGSQQQVDTMFLCRVMSCSCRLHLILGWVPYHGAELVTYRGAGGAVSALAHFQFHLV